jgi:hypothetical protein
MHIYISQRVQNELNLSNKFLAGTILPDMIKIKLKKRDETHYIKEYNNGTKRLPDLDKFLEENKDKLKDQITIGYYAHLIEDRIWFDKYVDSFAKCIDKESILYISNNTIHNNEEFRNDIYSDYANVDSYLIQKNNMDLSKIRFELKQEVKGYYIDEVIDENVVFPSNIKNAKINFISQSCLNDYINESVKLVKEKIIELLGE